MESSARRNENLPPTIEVCPLGHHFLGKTCDVCGGPTMHSYPRREGDCIACGAFCGAQAYCCNSPSPITQPTDQ